LTLHTDSGEPVRQVAPLAVGVVSNASSCGPRCERSCFTCDLVIL